MPSHTRRGAFGTTICVGFFVLAGVDAGPSEHTIINCHLLLAKNLGLFICQLCDLTEIIFGNVNSHV